MRVPAAPQGLSVLWFQPRFAPLLTQQKWTRWISAVGFAHIGLELSGIGGLGCILHDLVGIRCPGCGLTTAFSHAWHGDWQTSVSDHVFLPLFLGAFGLVVLVSVLPEKARQGVIRSVAACEERTGMVALIACAIMAYWLARIVAPG